MEKIAVFAGSFDPMTTGHEALLRRALPLFDKIIVAVGVNMDKRGCFALEERLKWIGSAVADMPNVEVATYDCLTTDFCRECGARYILRGLRSAADFDYEQRIADINKLLAPEIETVFILSAPEYSMISSSMIRELKAFGKDYQKYVAK